MVSVLQTSADSLGMMAYNALTLLTSSLNTGSILNRTAAIVAWQAVLGAAAGCGLQGVGLRDGRAGPGKPVIGAPSCHLPATTCCLTSGKAFISPSHLSLRCCCGSAGPGIAQAARDKLQRVFGCGK